MTLERRIDLYASAWSESDPTQRKNLLRQTLTSDATYTDPNVHADGLDALVTHIGGILTDLPGAKVVRTSKVDSHHGMARFAWQLVKSNGTTLPEGLDIVTIDEATGKLKRILGFFGPLRVIEPK